MGISRDGISALASLNEQTVGAAFNGQMILTGIAPPYATGTITIGSALAPAPFSATAYGFNSDTDTVGGYPNFGSISPEEFDGPTENVITGVWGGMSGVTNLNEVHFKIENVDPGLGNRMTIVIADMSIDLYQDGVDSSLWVYKHIWFTPLNDIADFLTNNVGETVEYTVKEYVDPAYAFKIKVKTDNAGTSNNNQFTLPLHEHAYYDMVVDWGDGTSQSVYEVREYFTTYGITHTYPEVGEYVITLTGNYTYLRLSVLGEGDKITDVMQWGNNPWVYTSLMFYGCKELTVLSATDTPNLSTCVTAASMFQGASKFNSYIGDWDVSNIFGFTAMFAQCSLYNQPLDQWVLGPAANPITLSSLLTDCVAFDQSLGNLNVNDILTMEYILRFATGMSPANIDATLIAWADQMPDVAYNILRVYMGGPWTAASATARGTLNVDRNWQIYNT